MGWCMKESKMAKSAETHPRDPSRAGYRQDSQAKFLEEGMWSNYVQLS